MSGRQSDESTLIGVARRTRGVAAATLPPLFQREGVHCTSGSLSVTVNRFDGWTLVAFAGVIDGVTAPELHSVLQEFTDQSVTVDLYDATFLDASGLRTLLRVRERIVLGGGRLAIRSLRPNVQKELERTVLTDPRSGAPVTT